MEYSRQQKVFKPICIRAFKGLVFRTIPILTLTIFYTQSLFLCNDTKMKPALIGLGSMVLLASATPIPSGSPSSLAPGSNGLTLEKRTELDPIRYVRKYHMMKL